MNPERWQKLDRLFHAALEIEYAARGAFVTEATSGDDELREELESLLAHHEQSSSLIDSPAYVLAAESILDVDSSETLIGQTLGQYQVLRVLGKGGMGVVYLAFDHELHRNVALKFLHDDLLSDQQRVQRFKQEARAASALNHPNILTIHQIGDIAGRQFIATEFVEGETLRELMKRQRLTFTQALDIAIQIASALSAAHAAEIIHRDIKPENIMVRPDGYVKVLDFGLAKLSEPPAASSESSTLINTEQGTIIGTVQYMSPEQTRGLRADARTDIWSLGVALYEILTEHPPFVGQTKSDVIAAILEREPLPLASYSPGVSAELQSIVTKTLRKDRDERYSSAKELLQDLRRLKQRLEPDESAGAAATLIDIQSGPDRGNGELARQTQANVAAQPTSSAEYILSEIKQHKKSAMAVLLAIVMAVAALAFWRFGMLGRTQTTMRPQAMSMTKLATSDRVQGAAISPDGKYVAHVVAEPMCCFQQSLWLSQLGTSSAIQIDPPSGLLHQRLIFSPDGKYLYFADNSDNLYQMSAFGGPKTKLISGVSSSISFSPDGRRFAFIRDGYPGKDETALMAANADGSGAEKIASHKKPDFFGGGPAWSPTEPAIACAAGSVDERGRHMNVVEVRLQDGGERPINSQRWNDVGPVSWLSDGSGLLMLADQNSIFSPQIWQISYPNGEARRVTNDFNSYEGLSLTADSTMLVTEQVSQSANIWIARNKGQTRQISSAMAGSYDDLSWLDEGHLIYDSNAGGSWDLWGLDVEKSTRKQLTINSNANGDSSVSLDGRYVFFASNRTGPVNIWRMDADGANSKQLTRGNIEDDYPQCSPDGKWVIYESTRSDKVTLWKVPIDGGDPIQLVDKPAEKAAISPDGKWVVYQSAGPGESTLWKVSIDGGDPIQLFDKHSANPVISPDGKLIACRYRTDPTKDEWKIAVIPFEGGAPIQVLDIPAHPFWDRLSVQWSADSSAITYKLHRNGIDRNGIDNLWSQPLEGGPAKQLTHFDANQIFSFTWSRGGQLALSRGVETREVVLLANFR
jgi:serine/threonine protein kinase/Tol biopolymer transport system component